MRRQKHFLIKTIFLALLFWVFLYQGAFASQLEIHLNHLIIEPSQEGRLHITEQYMIFNKEETPFQESGLALSLPAGAMNIHFDEEVEVDKIHLHDEEIIFEQEFPPGETVLVFHYLIDSLGQDHYHFDKIFSRDIPVFFAIIPAGFLEIISEDLEDQGITSMGGRQLHIYGGSFEKGDSLSLVIYPGTGSLPQGEAAGFGDRNIAPPLHSKAHIDFWNASPLKNIEPHLFMLIVVGIPLGLLGRYLFKKGQASERETKSLSQKNKQELSKLKVKEDILREKLIELEKDFAKGKLSEKVYKERLSVYKRKLIDIRVKIKELSK